MNQKITSLNRYTISSFITSFLCLTVIVGCSIPPPPKAFGPVPSARQLAWHQMKYYAFIHFGPNTFTNKEWGYGDEPESIFNPTELDCRQWARVAKEAGMEGIILTAKHHDGFCLWPTTTTTHSVKNSPWKNGHGDVVAELQAACKEYGLKMGIYLSPWDRNNGLYGTSEYIKIYRAQMKELLSNYGDIFEFWFDGANGGDGYYGGARETRRIDNKTYYDWDNSYKIVRELQPMAVMFSDGGPDVRWIGNERGYAGETNWCTVRKGAFYAGIGGVNDQLQSGHADGDTWLPAEVNTSIRPGWFYHPEQDSLVKTLPQLVDNWFHSVGMNGNFLLNVPPDKRGLFHEKDVKRLMEFKAYRDQAFSTDLAKNAAISASSTRGGSSRYSAKNILDEDTNNYWATDDDVRTANVELNWAMPTEVNAIMLREEVALGQRVTGFTIESKENDTWVSVAKGTTVGNRRMVSFETRTMTRLRIKLEARASLVIASLAVYRTPDIK